MGACPLECGCSEGAASRQPSAPSGRAGWGRARWSVDAQRGAACHQPSAPSGQTCLALSGLASSPLPELQGGASAAIAGRALPWAGLWRHPAGRNPNAKRLQPPQNGQPLFSWAPISQGQRLRPFRVGPLVPPYASIVSASSLSCERVCRGRLGRSPASRGAPGDWPPPARFPQLPRAGSSSACSTIRPRATSFHAVKSIGTCPDWGHGRPGESSSRLASRLLLAGDLLENRPQLPRPLHRAANLDRIRGERTRSKVEQAVQGGNRVGSDHVQELDLSGKKHRCSVLCLGEQRVPEHTQENEQEGD